MDSFGRGYSGEIYRLCDAVNGVQVMWPLPKHIDSARVFNAVPLSKDVDGIHFASWGSEFPEGGDSVAVYFIFALYYKWLQFHLRRTRL